jgi:hypothetical protein
MQPTIAIYHTSTPAPAKWVANQSFLYSKDFYNYYKATINDSGSNPFIYASAIAPRLSVNTDLKAAERGGAFLYRIKMLARGYYMLMLLNGMFSLSGNSFSCSGRLLISKGYAPERFFQIRPSKPAGCVERRRAERYMRRA